MKLASLLAAMLLALVAPVFAQTPTGVWSNSFTLEGEPKYGPDYTHYDYVNVDAPKGGVVRLGNLGGFDTFNPILPKGETAGDIAKALSLSVKTVSTYRTRILEKMGMKTNADITTYAIKNSLLP